MIIQKKSFKKNPWKNGLGVTEEIAIHPETASLAQGNFLWRISTARVEIDSAFSIFSNYERILIIYQGNGLRIIRNGTVKKVPLLEAFEFDGTESIQSELIDGPVSDLSIFRRKGRVKSKVSMEKFGSGETFDWASDAEWNLAFAVQGNFETEEGILRAGDACSSEKPTRLKSLSDDAIIVFISLNTIGN